MRRSMVSMLVVLGALSTPLAAQTEPAAPPPGAAPQPRANAIGVGFAATVGSGWQIEAGEIGYVRRTGGGLLRAFSVGARLGSYVDEGAIIGGNRGFVFAPTVAARSGRLTLAQLGDENNLTQIGFDVTLEATGYITTNPPPLQRATWGAVALLPGLRVGGGDGPQYGLVVGPTWFFGSKTEVRGLLAFRVEAPLARRERHP